MGWITVVCYVIAGVLSAVVLALRASRQRVFWFVLTVLLALLAVNKQLDLQSALTAIGRCMAQMQGWYDQRKTVQLTFILVLAAFSLVFVAVLAWNLRKGFARIWLAFFGFAFLLTFVVMRAASFHHFDRLINFELGPMRMNWFLELTGIAMIACNAILLMIAGPEPEPSRTRYRQPESEFPYRRDHSKDRSSR